MQPATSRGSRLSDSGGFSRLIRNAEPRVVDAALAAALAVAGIVITLGRSSESGDFRSPDFAGAVLVAAQSVPLAYRRSAPLAVLTLISAALVAHSAFGYEVVQTGTVSSLIALYSAATLTQGRKALLAGGITAAAIAGFYLTNRGEWSPVDIAATSATWALAWLFGTFVRIRGEQAEAAGAKVVSLELEQEVRAREAVADERARMARELHDIVGHALNLIVIQAAGAQRVFDTRPELPKEALASIESTGREALVEMARMLGVLSPSPGEGALQEPQPGLGQLPGLAAHVSEAGIPVDLRIEGERPDVPASVDLSAYRIAQESLTNCLKHSGASRAAVTVRYRPDELEIEVVDNGSGQSPERAARGGRGHAGMRERVAVFGGEFSCGPLPAGGYRVWALLPYRGPAP